MQLAHECSNWFPNASQSLTAGSKWPQTCGLWVANIPNEKINVLSFFLIFQGHKTIRVDNRHNGTETYLNCFVKI